MFSLALKRTGVTLAKIGSSSSSALRQGAAINTTAHFSSYGGSYGGPQASSQYAGPIKAFPQYTVIDNACLLAVKIIPPRFSLTLNNTLVLDNKEKGRFLLEFLPRLGDGKVDRNNNMRFALSPEEVGFLLDQLTKTPQVVLARSPPPRDIDQSMVSQGIEEVTQEPAKVLRVTSGQAGETIFKVDYELDGKGGQTPPNLNEKQGVGPLEVTAQLGESFVIKELMRTSIPDLVGWNAQMEMTINNSINMAGAPRYQEPAPF